MNLFGKLEFVGFNMAPALHTDHIVSHGQLFKYHLLRVDDMSCQFVVYKYIYLFILQWEDFWWHIFVKNC